MQPSQEYREMLKIRIAAVAKTLSNLEHLPAPLGGRWREGMLRYYSGIHSELQDELTGLSAEIHEAGL
jgi:hypothetical protein